MMNTSPFRSHLMQSFAANARTQSRPPIALFSFGGENSSSDKQTGTGYRPQRYDASTSNRHPTSSSIKSCQLQKLRPFSATSSSLEEGDSSVAAAVSATTIPSDSTPPPLTVSTQQFQLQQLIASRRTVSNFVSHPSSQKLSDRHFLHDAIARGVEVAITAPNHKVTEPTTFHRILTPSVASERLLTIAYEVTLRRLLDNKLSGDEACRSEAIRKREKWAKIPAFVVATVSGMEDQASSDDVCEEDSYRELPHVPPATIRQLEDYASASASIQNLLLSLHAEGLGSKWATGPVIRTRAFRDLIGCDQKDMVVGLIMVGWPKSLPRLRRRRAVEGDVLRDVNYAP